MGNKLSRTFAICCTVFLINSSDLASAAFEKADPLQIVYGGMSNDKFPGLYAGSSGVLFGGATTLIAGHGIWVQGISTGNKFGMFTQYKDGKFHYRNPTMMERIEAQREGVPILYVPAGKAYLDSRKKSL